MSKPITQIKIRTRKDVQNSCGGRKSKGGCSVIITLPYMKIAA